jgi:hypothetical protein
MAITVQNLIDFTQPFTQYSPQNAGAGGLQPALGIVNELQNLVMGPPFTWPWNRNENSTITTISGTQDYSVPILDFGFLEKVTLRDPLGNTWEVKDVYNNLARGVADANTLKQGRPQACCVLQVTYGGIVKFRFMGVPDATYAVTFTYQKSITQLAALTGSTGTLVVPDQLTDVMQSLYLGEAMALVDDARATQYRQRGVGTLLAKAEGLTELQINQFLEQYWMRESQRAYRTGNTSLGIQARGQ